MAALGAKVFLCRLAWFYCRARCAAINYMLFCRSSHMTPPVRAPTLPGPSPTPCGTGRTAGTTVPSTTAPPRLWCVPRGRFVHIVGNGHGGLIKEICELSTLTFGLYRI